MGENNIHIIGLGVAERATLEPKANNALQSAEVVIGSARQLDIVAELTTQARCIELPPLAELKALIESLSNNRIAVLASGDPLYFGIGRWLYKNFSQQNIQCYGAVSSIQTACHRLGISLQDTDVVSLHGRPLASIKPHLRCHRTLVVLTDKHSLPQYLAAECVAAHFPDSKITICENLGYSSEHIETYIASALVQVKKHFSDLNICVVEIAGVGGVQPEFPGIPDHHFETGEAPGKGMISKREVRLCILSLMQINKQDIVWDIGAGCGGVSIEMAYWSPEAEIYALECHPERLKYLHYNRTHFGVVKNMHVVGGRAPEALEGLPSPTKIFVGGSDGELPTLLKYAWNVLPPGGTLVASGVIASTKVTLQTFAQQLQPSQLESVEISVQRGHLTDATTEGASDLPSRHIDYIKKLPVEIFKFIKTVNEI